ncbi:MAG: hypothetical protein WDN27_03660 [Candidatus Saccharibacteria bacterium]
MTSATTGKVSTEAEDGITSGNATATTDANASAGKAVKFGSNGPCALPNYPDASCTGVPAGTTLTTGPGLTITTPGVTVTGVDVPWIDVKAPNVTIKKLIYS